MCCYRCLEERRLFLGGDRKSVTLPPYTFIGATTHQAALAKPLLDRFKIILHLEHYSEAEIAQLITQRAKRLRWPISDEALAGLASRGRGTPRIAIWSCCTHTPSPVYVLPHANCSVPYVMRTSTNEPWRECRTR